MFHNPRLDTRVLQPGLNGFNKLFITQLCVLMPNDTDGIDFPFACLSLLLNFALLSFLNRRTSRKQQSCGS